MTPVLRTEDHDRIGAAIAAAELRTSGEIYCVVAHSVATYRWIPVSLAAFAVLCTPLVVLFFAVDIRGWWLGGDDWSTGNVTAADAYAAMRSGLVALAGLQIAVFIVVATLAWPRRFRLALTPRGMRRRKVLHAAHGQFLAQGLQKTTARTGLLLFVALAERQAVLIADEGIDSKVEQHVWDAAVAGLTRAAAADRVVEGLVAAIGQCGDILAVHFPPAADPANELPNRVVEL